MGKIKELLMDLRQDTCCDSDDLCSNCIRIIEKKYVEDIIDNK